MIVIFRPADAGSDGSRAIALFGAGLVGNAIVRTLRHRGGAPVLELPLSWHDAAQRGDDLASLTGVLLQRRETSAIETLDVVWTAGKAGFGAGHDELRREMVSFGDVVAWTEAMTTHLAGTRLSFHLVSSAGGLFEGQRFVDESSHARPRRPYGEARLQQEQLAMQLGDRMVVHVYRPSSIYGYSGHGGRSGLINTLILNAKRRSVSRIFGGADTIRDYVLAEDVAHFIATRILRWSTRSQTFVLASGRPASVREIVQIVRRVTGTPLYLKLDVEPSNAGHITFMPSALPRDWRPTDLETGIRLVSRQLAGAFESGLAPLVPRYAAP